MFVPVPPQSNQPAPAPPPDERPLNCAELEDDAAPADEEPDLDLAALPAPTVWPAVVRWARLCRVLAYVSLIIFGFFAASNLYRAAIDEPQFAPFVPHVSSTAYLGYALLWAILAVAVCLSLLGFAELLHVILSIEAAAHRLSDEEDMPEPDAQRS